MPTSRQRLLMMMSGNDYVTLPQNLITSPGILYENFEAIGTWNIALGAIAVNAVEFKQGTQSIKVTTNAGATSTFFKIVNWTLPTNWQGISVWVYVHNVNPADFAWTIFMLDLYNDAIWTAHMGHVVGIPTSWLNMTGWHRIYLPKSYFLAFAGGTFASPILNVAFTIPSTNSVIMSFDDLEVE